MLKVERCALRGVSCALRVEGCELGEVLQWRSGIPSASSVE